MITNLQLSDLLSLLGNVFSITSFILTIYLILKVQKIEKIRQREREYMKSLLQLDKVDYLLEKLKETIASLNLSQEKDFIDVISKVQGEIEGALKAIGITTPSSKINIQVMLSGYYNISFFKNIVSKAKKEIIIVAYRNKRLSDYTILEILEKKLKENVKITIYHLSPCAPDYVLESIREKLPTPPANLQELKWQILNYTKEILDFVERRFSEKIKKNLKYKWYYIVPRYHIVKVDDIYYVSLTNQNPNIIKVYYKRKRLTPSLIIEEKSPIGEYIKRQIKYIDQNSENVFKCYNTCYNKLLNSKD